MRRSPSAPTDSQAALIAFYAADMKSQGWQISDRGPARNDPGALEVLGKLAGSDGYYWQMGATVDATTFVPAVLHVGPPTSPCGSSRPLIPNKRDADRGRGGGDQIDPTATTTSAGSTGSRSDGGAGSASR